MWRLIWIYPCFQPLIIVGEHWAFWNFLESTSTIISEQDIFKLVFKVGGGKGLETRKNSNLASHVTSCLICKLSPN